MSCCRTITTYENRTVQAVSRMRAANNHIEMVDSVYDALDLYREVLGNYQVSRNLTQKLRRELEPSVSKVWTSKELSTLVTKTSSFGVELSAILHKWASRYCKKVS